MKEDKVLWCQVAAVKQQKDPRNLTFLFLPGPVPEMPASCQQGPGASRINPPKAKILLLLLSFPGSWGLPMVGASR